MPVTGPEGGTPGGNPQGPSELTDKSLVQSPSPKLPARLPPVVEGPNFRLALQFDGVDPYLNNPCPQIQIDVKTPEGKPLVTFKTHPLNPRLSESLISAFPLKTTAGSVPEIQVIAVKEVLFARMYRPWIVTEAPLSDREHPRIPGAFYLPPTPQEFLQSPTGYNQGILVRSEGPDGIATMSAIPNPDSGFVVVSVATDGGKQEQIKIPLVPSIPETRKEFTDRMTKVLSRVAAVFSERGTEALREWIEATFPDSIAVPADSSSLTRREGDLARAILSQGAISHTIQSTGAQVSLDVGMHTACIEINPKHGEQFPSVTLVITVHTDAFTSMQLHYLQTVFSLLCSEHPADRSTALASVLGKSSSKIKLLENGVSTKERWALNSSLSSLGVNTWGTPPTHPDLVPHEILSEAALHDIAVAPSSNSDQVTVREYLDGETSLVFSTSFESGLLRPETIRVARLVTGPEGRGRLILSNMIGGVLEVPVQLSNASDPSEVIDLSIDLIRALNAQKTMSISSVSSFLSQHEALSCSAEDQFELAPDTVSHPPPTDPEAADALALATDFITYCREGGANHIDTFSCTYAGDGCVLLTLRPHQDSPTLTVRLSSTTIKEVYFSVMTYFPNHKQLLPRRTVTFSNLKGMDLNSDKAKLLFGLLEYCVCTEAGPQRWSNPLRWEKVIEQVATTLGAEFSRHDHPKIPQTTKGQRTRRFDDQDEDFDGSEEERIPR